MYAGKWTSRVHVCTFGSSFGSASAWILRMIRSLKLAHGRAGRATIPIGANVAPHSILLQIHLKFSLVGSVEPRRDIQ
eukprot:SAG31_NODE_4785_length_2956_cov_23.715086_3_plen_78_part_00